MAGLAQSQWLSGVMPDRVGPTSERRGSTPGEHLVVARRVVGPTSERRGSTPVGSPEFREELVGPTSERRGSTPLGVQVGQLLRVGAYL